MSTPIQNASLLSGRLLMALMFIPAGFGKVTGFSSTVGYITSAGLPMPTLAAAVAVGVEILAGVALLVGVGTRAAALVLAFFTLVASVFFHNYWGVPAEQAYVQQLMFFKNIAIVGGLLAIAAVGAGSWSIEGRRNESYPSQRAFAAE